MTVTAVATAAILLSGPKLPSGCDPNFDAYFAQALTHTAKEPRRALAMFELLLIPEGTEARLTLDNLPAEERAVFAEGIEKGFALWTDALGDEFPLKLSKEGRRSSFEVKVVDSIDQRFHQMGELMVTRRAHWARRTHIAELSATLRISRYSNPGRLLTVGEVTHIVAHEIGHALGLADTHSLRRIMGPVHIGRPFARLTEDEIARVKQIRETLREAHRTTLAGVR